MIDPVIFKFNLLGLPIELRWYGVLVMLGAVVGAFIAEREIKRRGENGESIWDALVWVLPAGIIGARLWYVLNNILGGSDYYTSDPSKILKVWEGGLHFFGGLLFGGIALYYFLKQNGMDFWLFLDAIAPAALIGQALARPANFINQELYGQPTQLMWGIPIDAGHRLPQFSDLTQFPVETTRFHPTFAYEMILNILMGLLLLWIARRYAKEIKPGAIFSGWLISAGLIRTFVEFFRPDQPKIGDSFITYSMLVSFLMAIAGVVMLLVRNRKLNLAIADGWEEQYYIKSAAKETRARRERVVVEKAVVKDMATAHEVKREVTAAPEKKRGIAKVVPVTTEVKQDAAAIPEKKRTVVDDVVVITEAKEEAVVVPDAVQTVSEDVAIIEEVLVAVPEKKKRAVKAKASEEKKAVAEPVTLAMEVEKEMIVVPDTTQPVSDDVVIMEDVAVSVPEKKKRTVKAKVSEEKKTVAKKTTTVEKKAAVKKKPEKKIPAKKKPVVKKAGTKSKSTK